MNRAERLQNVAKKAERRIVGLMSGTSLDAIDAAMVRIKGHGPEAAVRLEHFRCYPFPPKLRVAVRDLFDPDRARVDQICRYDFILGELFAAAVLRLCKDAKVPTEKVDLVAAAGQTIWHDPDPVTVNADVDWIEDIIETRSTLAIGQSAVIAERTGIITIGDLRVRDIAAGGHGAPLVAYFDWVQGRHKKRGRAMQNIGGIANVSYVKPGAKLEDVSAFDNGPGNMVIDELVFLLTDGAEVFDRDGERAARGTVREDILAWCLANPYFELKPPKTTGRERFGRQYARQMIDAFPDAAPDDLIATATALTAESIADSYRRWVFPLGPVDDVIVGGGGARNPVLMEMLRQRLPGVDVRAYDYPDAKEAMAMALIANDSILGLPTNAPSATGAAPTILGKICL